MVERAPRYTQLAPDALFLVEVDDPVFVLDDRPRCRARVQTAGLLAVKAGILLDQPLEVVRDLDLVEAHEEPRVRAEVTVALHASKVLRGLHAELVPLLTRHLAPFAADTARDVDQLRVLGSRSGSISAVGPSLGRVARRSRDPPDGETALGGLRALVQHAFVRGHQAFSRFTRKALNSGQLVLASPTKGVRLLAIEPVVIPLKPQ